MSDNINKDIFPLGKSGLVPPTGSGGIVPIQRMPMDRTHLRCIAVRDSERKLLAVGMVCPDGTIILRWFSPERTAVYSGADDCLKDMKPENSVQILYQSSVEEL